MYRSVNEQWTRIDTRVIRDDGNTAHYEALTRGFSIFAVGTFDLAKAWAPVIFQETLTGDNSQNIPRDDRADFITGFDFDSDPNLIGNWDAFYEPDANLNATVYWWVVETPKHWFIGYGVFHSRDWGNWTPAVSCDETDSLRAGACHENDMEGLVLVVERDQSKYGSLLGMLTRYHNELIGYTCQTMTNPCSSTELPINSSEIEPIRLESGRPSVYIEAKGHAIAGTPPWGGFRANRHRHYLSTELWDLCSSLRCRDS